MATTVEEVIKQTKPKMESVIEDLKRKLATIRTGKATISLLDGITVDYYGVATPLNQLASISVPEPQLLVVQPWDVSQIGAIEKAIIAANLGFNPSNDGKVIRLPIPPLTEERRRQLAKQVSEVAEEHRIAIRNIRHHANDQLKKMLKEKLISEDLERDGLEQVQKLTNNYISKIDELAKNKEKEIMHV